MVLPIVMAFLGGLTTDILQLIEVSKTPRNRRPNFKDKLYWFPYIAWPLLGALLAFVYLTSDITLRPILAFQVGLSAPMIIRSLASANPFAKATIDPGEGA